MERTHPSGWCNLAHGPSRPSRLGIVGEAAWERPTNSVAGKTQAPRSSSCLATIVATPQPDHSFGKDLGHLPAAKRDTPPQHLPEAEQSKQKEYVSLWVPPSTNPDRRFSCLFSHCFPYGPPLYFLRNAVFPKKQTRPNLVTKQALRIRMCKHRAAVRRPQLASHAELREHIAATSFSVAEPQFARRATRFRAKIGSQNLSRD